MKPHADVILVGGHAILLGAIAARLEYEHHCNVVELVATPEQARESLRRRSADILIMDIDGADTDFLNDLNELRTTFPGLCIVLMGSSIEARQAAALLDADIQGLVVREQWTREISDAIRTVLSGRTYIPPPLQAGIAAVQREPKRGDRAGPDGAM